MIQEKGSSGQAMHFLRFLIFLVLCTSLGTARAQQSQALTIFAATSLTDAFEALRTAFLDERPQAQVSLHFANSSTLAAQLLQGAPADIFASANAAQMQLVLEGDLATAADIEHFAYNQLALITPADNPAELHALADLARPGVLLVLAAESTPIRSYTDAMLEAYAQEHDERFLRAVYGNVASEERNVRLVTARVALGEADAGIVYVSDSMGDIAADLHVIDIDPAYNQLAAYPVAQLSEARNPSLARYFVDFLLSPPAQRILASFGFCADAILQAPASPTPEPSPDVTQATPAPAQPCPPAPASG